MGLLLLGAAAAAAQTTPRILVSNASQGSDDVANTSGNDHEEAADASELSVADAEATEEEDATPRRRSPGGLAVTPEARGG